MRLTIVLIISCIFAATLASTAAASSNLADAVAKAQSGDVISLEATVYSGAANCNILIQKNLTLISPTAQTVVDCSHTSRCLTVANGASVTIIGVAFINGNASASTTSTQRSFHKPEISLTKWLPVRRHADTPRRVVFTMTMTIDPDGSLHSISRRRKKQRQTDGHKPPVVVNAVPDTARASIAVVPVGGCLWVRQSSVVLRAVSLTGCSAQYGSGIGAEDSAVTISDTLLSSNGGKIAKKERGGGGYFRNCTVLLVNVTASHNFLTGGVSGSGGGLYFERCGRVELESVIAHSNVLALSSFGGGFFFSFCNDVIVKNSSALKNKMITGGNDIGYGAGFCFIDTTNVVIQSSTATGNALPIGGYGGGYSFTHCSNVTILSSSASDNYMADGFGGGYFSLNTNNFTMQSSSAFSNRISPGAGSGAGYSLYNSLFIEIIGCFFTGNTISTGQYQLPTSIYVSPPNASQNCLPSTTITESFGSITGGISGNISFDISCSWTLSPHAIVEALYYLRINVTKFELPTGLLSFYNGSSQSSPRIGTYTSSFAELYCYNGPCPRFDDLATTVNLFILFESDGSSTAPSNGFALEWTTEKAQTGLERFPSSVFPDIRSFGGGIQADTSQILIVSSVISSNVISNQVFSLGGGVSSLDSSVVIINSTFLRNVVIGNIAAGGAVYSRTDITIENSRLDGNTAVGTGWCIPDPDFILRCPASFGGAVYGSNVTVQNSILTSNSVSCSNDFNTSCTANGAALSIAGPSVLSQLQCTDNTVVCDASIGCSRSKGGCLHGFGAKSSSLSSSNLTGNLILGVGSGGAVALEDSHALTISQSLIQNNTAREAGAASVNGQASLTLRGSLVTLNRGESFAGAISSLGDVTLAIYNSTVEANAASRVSSVMSYNDDDAAAYTFVGSRFVDGLGDGVALFMLGRINFVDNVWSSSRPGTIYTQDETGEFFSISYSTCRAGTYTLLAASTEQSQGLQVCHSCPFGAICHGADAMTSGLHAQRGFFGVVKSITEVEFHACPPGYCCKNATYGCPYQFCEGERVGTLCGQCPEGMGFVFFSLRCAQNSECDGARWAWLLILSAASTIVVFLLATNKKGSTGSVAVVLFFYQVLPLVKSSPWKVATSFVITTLSSVFNLSPTSGETSSAGICLVPSMTAAQKLGARIIFQFIVLVVFGATYVANWILHRLGTSLVERHPPSAMQYLGPLVRFLTIAYTTLILVPLQMVQCVQILGRSVWWFDAEITCLEPLWQKLAIGAVVVFVPVPFVIVAVMHRWSDAARLSAGQREVRRVLSEGYCAKREWWLGVSLLRRLSLVIVYTTVTDLTWRAVVTSVLCILFLILHMRLAPFAVASTHRFETLCLTLLACLAASSAPALARIQYGTEEEMTHEGAMEGLQFACAVLPAVLFVVIFVTDAVRASRKKRDGRNGLGIGTEMTTDI